MAMRLVVGLDGKALRRTIAASTIRRVALAIGSPESWGVCFSLGLGLCALPPWRGSSTSPVWPMARPPPQLGTAIAITEKLLTRKRGIPPDRYFLVMEELWKLLRA